MKRDRAAKSKRASTANQVVLGIDFGTLSGRVAVIDASNGQELGAAVHEYRHGVIDRHLPGDKRRLDPDTALQHPEDYIRVLTDAVPRALRSSGVAADRVAGIGIDFTSCTMLPVAADGTPLCITPKWRKEPQAWVKLWKHHAAQADADRINEIGIELQPDMLRAYGGRHSCEWLVAKILETARKSPRVYAAAARFIEAGDWLVWQLTGVESRNLSAAGFKGMRVCQSAESSGEAGYPSPTFFKALHPALENIVATKLAGPIVPLGGRVGGLTAAMAKRLGLPQGIAVAAANIDAHVAVPACGATKPGQLLMIMGTSTCHLLVASQRQEVEGMCGVVKDGVIPGTWGYEAGQAGVGDLFAWFVENACPESAAKEARYRKQSIYQFLETGASKLAPGECGLLALDWWNGNRSVLMDADLTGLLVGATLATGPCDIYRAVLEATAFGTRKILEAFERSGIGIDTLYACGGLASKNRLLMQIYADVTGRNIHVTAAEQACALGAAMHGAVAAGIYRDIQSAAARMAAPTAEIFRPNKRSRPVYERLYAEYTRLHDYFGRDRHGTMKVLKQIRGEALSAR